MALINCPECSKEISDKASTCIGCGCPVGNLKQSSILKEHNNISKEGLTMSPISEHNFNSEENSEIGIYLFSLLIPIIGIILGIIYIGKNKEKFGLSLIGLSIFASMIYGTIIYALAS
jgi:hypothetical protein